MGAPSMPARGYRPRSNTATGPKTETSSNHTPNELHGKIEDCRAHKMTSAIPTVLGFRQPPAISGPTGKPDNPGPDSPDLLGTSVSTSSQTKEVSVEARQQLSCAALRRPASCSALPHLMGFTQRLEDTRGEPNAPFVPFPFNSAQPTRLSDPIYFRAAGCRIQAPDTTKLGCAPRTRFSVSIQRDMNAKLPLSMDWLIWPGTFVLPALTIVPKVTLFYDHSVR